MQNAKVEVLLSTYDGEDYLHTLLGSIFSQTLQPQRILIRDDGSIDSTWNIISAYSVADKVPITKHKGDNLGPTQSFSTLLKLSDANCDFFAFCDQDDYWESNKLAQAVELLSVEDQSQPLLYCSRLRLVDENLRFIGLSTTPKKKLSLENALVENVVTGCTMVINRQARMILTSKSTTAALSHDWWVYIVIAGFGKIVYDETSSILYRQHSCNYIGMQNGLGKWLRKSARNYRADYRGRLDAQAYDFLNLYGPLLDASKNRLLQRFLDRRKNIVTRLSYALRPDVYRQSMVEEILFRFMLALDIV